MKNGLGRDVKCPTRPSVTLPREASASEIAQVILSMRHGFGEGLAIGIFARVGRNRHCSQCLIVLNYEHGFRDYWEH